MLEISPFAAGIVVCGVFVAGYACALWHQAAAMHRQHQGRGA